MNTIKKKLYIYAGTTALGAAVCIPLIVNAVVSGQPVRFRLLFFIAAALLAAGLSVRGYRRLKAARLIAENQILHIRPAVFQEQDQGKGTDFLSCESMEVFVSCFGILLDSKIIKFNQDGIRLKAVELERDAISLTFGTDKKTRSIKLLHEEIDAGELAEIAVKFRYETGIVPLIRKNHPIG